MMERILGSIPYRMARKSKYGTNFISLENSIVLQQNSFIANFEELNSSVAVV